MPKNKRPRKKYVSGRHPITYPGVKRAAVEDIKQQISLAEIAIRIKLPRGEATLAELCQVRDLFNCLEFSLIHRRKVISEEDQEVGGDEVARAGIDLSAVIARGTSPARQAEQAISPPQCSRSRSMSMRGLM